MDGHSSWPGMTNAQGGPLLLQEGRSYVYQNTANSCINSCPIASKSLYSAPCRQISCNPLTPAVSCTSVLCVILKKRKDRSFPADQSCVAVLFLGGKSKKNKKKNQANKQNQNSGSAGASNAEGQIGPAAEEEAADEPETEGKDVPVSSTSVPPISRTH